MPDFLGAISVPENPASGSWPLPVEYGTVRVLAPKVLVHTFGASNEKVEQRYYVGAALRSFRLAYPRLTVQQLETLKAFWAARKGGVQPFSFTYPLEAGGTETLTVRFAGDSLGWSHGVATSVSLQVELIEVPTVAPAYAIDRTLDRFPDAGLSTDLLRQDQEIIPLVWIRPKLSSGETYPDNIFLSDRRCTVGGQLYQARILDWSGISQAIGGENDRAQFVLGNADGVLEDLASDIDLQDATIRFSLYHVASEAKLDLWQGEIGEFDVSEDGAKFTITGSDTAGALNEFCPQRVVERQCGKNFNDGTNCPFATAGTGSFTTCEKSWEDCDARGMTNYFGGVVVMPQGVNQVDKSGLGKLSRRSYTSTSQVNDSAYGQVLKHIYTDAPLPVDCVLASGREEGDFYAALGIVGEGPLSAYDADGAQHRLDGQPPHGPLPLGLRRSLGQDPAANNAPDPNSDKFSLGQGTPQTYDVFKAAGVAFLDIRRTDAKGQQLSKIADHSMVASVSGGLGGWHWPSVGTRAWAQPLTNPIWIGVNEWLRTKQVFAGSQAQQEATFDVQEAIEAAAISSDVVPVVVGTGTETQYRFRGVLAEQKSLKDQLQEILNNALAFYYVRNGKLRVGIKHNASAVEAFTAGNIIVDSLRMARRGQKTKFNALRVQFADAEYDYKPNVVTADDEVHRKRYGHREGAQLNLLGTFTKSQAARIAVTRLREELGGINPAEWKNQRAVSFRTTVLALAVEPGMVVSITHHRVPGGSIKLRVKRVTWNSDWSVDVEGDTVVDSMYDLTIGPKPKDVAVPPVSVEPVQSVPGDIREISGNAFNFTNSVIEDSNGVKRIAIDVTYDPPLPRGVFSGVSAWLETPSGLYPLGDIDYNGDGSNVTPGRYGTARLVAPPPEATESWKPYLTSRSPAYRVPLKLSTDPAPTPHVTMSVDPVDAIGGAAPPAENVASVSANVFYVGYESGATWGVDIVVGFGSIDRSTIARAEIIIRGPQEGDSVDRLVGSFVPPPTGDYLASVGGEWIRQGSDRTFTALIVCYNADNVPTAAPLESSDFVVEPVDTLDVASVSAAGIWTEYTADGLLVWGLTWSFTQANIDTSHTEIWIRAYDPATSAYRAEQLHQATAPGGVNNGDTITDRGQMIDAVPSASRNIQVIFYTIDTRGNRKPSPHVETVSVGPGTGSLKGNRIATSTLGGALTNNGTTLNVTTAGISTSYLANLAVDNSKLGALSVDAAKLATGSVTTVKIASGAVDTAALAALAVDATRLATGAVTSTKIASAAVGTAAIANLAVGTAQIANAAIDSSKIANLAVGTAAIANLAVGTAQIADLAVTNAKINDLAANKITAGTISASVSMTSPNITSTSGSLSVNMNSGRILAQATNVFAQMQGGEFIVYNIANSQYGEFKYDRVYLRDASGNNIIDAQSSYVRLGKELQMGTTPMINTSGQFVGNGVNVGANGVNAAGYNINGGFLGTTLISWQVVADIRDNAGTIEKKTRTLDARGGVLTSIGLESGWTAI